MTAVVGATLAVAAALMIYLASPNRRRTPARRWRTLAALSGLALIPLSIIALAQWAGPATAIFIALTLLMLVWSTVPLAVAWRRGADERTP